MAKLTGRGGRLHEVARWRGAGKGWWLLRSDGKVLHKGDWEGAGWTVWAKIKSGIEVAAYAKAVEARKKESNYGPVAEFHWAS